ncbi:MAG: hypothetical protein ABWX94_01675 [Candidatus Saccharimonadales bacterium]
MVGELNTAITEYQEKWERLVAGRKDKSFFKQLRPTSVAWKAEDLADFDSRLAALRDQADQIHIAWLNGRWLATIHLRETTLVNGLTIVKLMQRRPESTDATGLDHLDFYFDPSKSAAKDILDQEPNLKWTEEKNGDHCKWISVWFENTEAKIRGDTVLDVCADEMRDLSVQIATRNDAV